MGSAQIDGSQEPTQTDPLVECHSGYEYAERPVAIRWEGQRMAIEDVEAEWRIPGGKRFRVRAAEGRRFELFYGELYDEWRITEL